MGEVFDFITDIFNDVWDMVSRVVQEIGRVLSQVVAAIGEAWVWVGDHWMIIVLIIIVIVSIYCFWIAPAIWEIAGTFGAGMSASTVEFCIAVQAYAAYIEAFAVAIHLKTILAIHQIAYVLSSDYREMINSMYNQISKVSGAMGMGVDTMNLILRDARMLALDVASTLGQKFDLAEIGWLTLLTDNLKKMSSQMTRYQNNPGYLLNDFAEWFDKPLIDSKGTAMQIVFTAVDAAAKIAVQTVERMTIIKNDLDRLVKDMPQFVRNIIDPALGNVLRQYDQFINDVYKPNIGIINGLISSLGERQADLKTGMQDIFGRMRRPGTLLKGITELPDDEQASEYAAVAEVANYVPAEEYFVFERQLEPVIDSLQTSALKERPEMPSPAWDVRGVSIPMTPGEKKAGIEKTPFVGEY